jgi:hypothetical protein
MLFFYNEHPCLHWGSVSEHPSYLDLIPVPTSRFSKYILSPNRGSCLRSQQLFLLLFPVGVMTLFDLGSAFSFLSLGTVLTCLYGPHRSRL